MGMFHPRISSFPIREGIVSCYKYAPYVKSAIFVITKEGMLKLDIHFYFIWRKRNNFFNTKAVCTGRNFNESGDIQMHIGCSNRDNLGIPAIFRYIDKPVSKKPPV